MKRLNRKRFGKKKVSIGSKKDIFYIDKTLFKVKDYFGGNIEFDEDSLTEKKVF
jgi:hypothetical protein